MPRHARRRSSRFAAPPAPSDARAALRGLNSVGAIAPSQIRRLEREEAIRGAHERKAVTGYIRGLTRAGASMARLPAAAGLLGSQERAATKRITAPRRPLGVPVAALAGLSDLDLDEAVTLPIAASDDELAGTPIDHRRTHFDVHDDGWVTLPIPAAEIDVFLPAEGMPSLLVDPSHWYAIWLWCGGSIRAAGWQTVAGVNIGADAASRVAVRVESIALYFTPITALAGER